MTHGTFGSELCSESTRQELLGCAGHAFVRMVPTCGAVPLRWSEIQHLSPFAASQQPLESPYQQCWRSDVLLDMSWDVLLTRLPQPPWGWLISDPKGCLQAGAGSRLVSPTTRSKAAPSPDICQPLRIRISLGGSGNQRLAKPFPQSWDVFHRRRA